MCSSIWVSHIHRLHLLYQSPKTTTHIGKIKIGSIKEIADGCGEETAKEALFPNHLLESPKNIRVEHGYDAEVKFYVENILF